MIGIGGAGCKVAVESSNSIGCNCVLVSNDKKDFNENNCSIFINSKKAVRFRLKFQTPMEKSKQLLKLNAEKTASELSEKDHQKHGMYP